MSKGNIVSTNANWAASSIAAAASVAEPAAAIGGPAGYGALKGITATAATLAAAEVEVTFDSSTGPRTYVYRGYDAIAVLRGEDPAQFHGERI